MLTQLIKLLKILASEASPMQISLGVALAMIAGFTPLFSLHNLLVVFILLTFRINLAAFLLALAFFSGIAYLLDPVFHQLGATILHNEALQPTWTTMYNSMFWRIASFNNTIVMGSLTVSLLAFLPLVLVANILIKQYRSNFLVFINKSNIVRYLQSSKLITRLSSMMES